MATDCAAGVYVPFDKGEGLIVGADAWPVCLSVRPGWRCRHDQHFP